MTDILMQCGPAKRIPVTAMRADIMGNMRTVFPAFRMFADALMKFADDNELFFLSNDNQLTCVIFCDTDRAVTIDSVVERYERLCAFVEGKKGRPDGLLQCAGVRLELAGCRFPDDFLRKVAYTRGVVARILEINPVVQQMAFAYVVHEVYSGALRCGLRVADEVGEQNVPDGAPSRPPADTGPEQTARAQEAGHAEHVPDMRSTTDAGSKGVAQEKLYQDDFFSRAQLTDREVNEFAALRRKLAELSTKQ